jgi:hypothetical protein
MAGWRFTSLFTRAPRYKFFVSYSRVDQSQVDYLISFLRVATEKVFRDTMNIPPGSIWSSETAKAIKNCETVLLFWCKHSAASDEVRKEFTKAIELKRKVVPVLLDETILPIELSMFQGVDLRDSEHDQWLEETNRSAPIALWWAPPPPVREAAQRFAFELGEILKS